MIWCAAKPSFSHVQNGQIEFAKRCIGSKEEIRAIVWEYSIAQVYGLGEKVTQYFSASLILHHAQRRSSPPQLQN